ncbi:MAG TPA: hypothetical protein VG096_06310 [Bryobacteraceae bacterium]|jgi:hypothetical protein|nr:hypothetical protein [Bryobacteraceae bacterium]
MSWQLLTVHYNYGGNLTALFCTGVLLGIPPALEREHIYRFPNRSSGYDGQAYHYVAHDPLARTEIARALGPDGAYRYPRILLPAMAYLMALGRQDWIDRSYIACNLFFLFLGAWWLTAILIRLGMHPGFAVLYLLVPGVLISVDRLIVDLPLISLSLGFLVYTASNVRWRLYLILVLAALCRETGFVLALACAIPPLFARRYRQSLFWASALLPAIAWYGFVRWFLVTALTTRTIPLLGPLGTVLLHPIPYPFPAATTTALRILDGLLLFGEWVAVVGGLRRLKEAPVDPVCAAMVLWAIVGIPVSVSTDFYSSSRALTPLLLFGFLRGLSERRRVDRLPLLMVSPRIWIQLLPQVGGVLRGIVAG